MKMRPQSPPLPYSSVEGAMERAARQMSPQSTPLQEKMNPARTMKSEHEECSCGSPGGICTCKNAPGMRHVQSMHIYAVGKVEGRFPSESIEKEFASARGKVDAAGLTDRETLRSVLSQPQNRYLARQMCWVFTIEGLATYILQPNDPSYYDQLVEALRPAPLPTDIDVVIGVKGSLSLPEMCGGLMVPIVMFDQLYSFDIDSLVKSIPKPEKMETGRFKNASEEILGRILQIADNIGAADEHRAVNYLAVRYDQIYYKAAEAFAANFSLTAVEVRRSRLSGVRKVVDVIFSYVNRNTDFTEKYFVRVDVTEKFPFLVTKLSPYYDRL